MATTSPFRTWWRWSGVGLGLVAVLFASGCPRQPPAAPKDKDKAVEVLILPAIEKVVTDSEDFTGRLEAFKKVEIQARVTGYLEKVNFQEGGKVKAGQVLFEIDPRVYKAELDRAEAALVQAKARFKRLEGDLQRAQSLLISRSISKEEYEKVAGDHAEAHAAVGVAQATQKSAQVMMEYTKVYSPISGLAGKAMIDEGNLVKADMTILTTVVTPQPVFAYFDVDERTLLRVRRLITEGLVKSARDVEVPVRMALADEKDFPHEGLINFVDNQVDPGTGTLRLRGEFKNPKGFLSPGMFVRVRVQVGNPHHSILAPEQGVGVDQGQKFVYVVSEQNEVEYRKVKTGALLQGWRVIQEGLQPGEKVIVSGLQRIRPKSKVEPKLAAGIGAKANDPLPVVLPKENQSQK